MNDLVGDGMLQAYTVLALSTLIRTTKVNKQANEKIETPYVQITCLCKKF